GGGRRARSVSGLNAVGFSTLGGFGVVGGLRGRLLGLGLPAADQRRQLILDRQEEFRAQLRGGHLVELLRLGVLVNQTPAVGGASLGAEHAFALQHQRQHLDQTPVFLGQLRLGGGQRQEQRLGGQLQL